MPPSRKPRHRHSPTQLAALNQLFQQTEHPTLAERTALAGEIGLEVKSVNSFFQNKRMKKRSSSSTASSSYTLTPMYPEDVQLSSSIIEEKISFHGGEIPGVGDLVANTVIYEGAIVEGRIEVLSLNQNGSTESQEPSGDLVASLVQGPVPHSTEPSRTAPAVLLADEVSFAPRSLRASSRRASPYSSSSSTMPLLSRPRRARPEPNQLDALKQLYSKTSTPTIEERSALALEIGMDVAKITNWFRNIRQSARKKARRDEGSDDDDADYSAGYGVPVFSSRSGSPSSTAESEFLRVSLPAHSSEDEDEDEEALTPSSPSSLSSPTHIRIVDFDMAAALDHARMQLTSRFDVKDPEHAAGALNLLQFYWTS